MWREGDPVDHLGDLCPGCGGPLEPVSDLSELVGIVLLGLFEAAISEQASLSPVLRRRGQHIAGMYRCQLFRLGVMTTTAGEYVKQGL